MGMRLPRRSKYGARRTAVDGLTFDSAREARRWGELLLLYRVEQISEPQRQVRIDCVVNGTKVCTYVCDFVYTDYMMPGNPTVYEDAKGYRNREYLLKKKLVFACHGIRIKET